MQQTVETDQILRLAGGGCRYRGTVAVDAVRASFVGVEQHIIDHLGGIANQSPPHFRQHGEHCVLVQRQ